MNAPLRMAARASPTTFGARARLVAGSALAGSLALTLASAAHALPVDGVVVGGTAAIAGGPAALTVTQSTENAAINWQSFSIGRGEAVTFVQPDARSVALNRVLGSDPSNILGRLSANGQVFLVNPNGVLFGAGSQVNVGGLVASTLAIRDADFMARDYRFAGAGPGEVVNRGAIVANGGSVALLGAQVSNQGLIAARLGAVSLAAGSAMTLDVAGDGLLSVTVQTGAINALAENGGVIRADGGRVLMTARSAGALLRTAVNNSGVIEARTVENRSGVIRLMGDMQAGVVTASGTLDASAPDGGDGGFVETSAATVHTAGLLVSTLAPSGKIGLWLLDPVDYLIAGSGGDETGAQVASTLTSSDRLITASHDITVTDVITWTSPQTLTLQAGNDATLSAAVNASGPGSKLIVIAGHDATASGPITDSSAGADIRFTAGNDLTVSGAMTASASGALIDLNAGHNVIQSAAITASSGGSIVMRADNDGTGGVTGGTVILSSPAAVTADALTIYYSPPGGYGLPTDYSSVSVAPGALATHMWVFAGAADKVYDGGTSATLAFRGGDPTLGGTVAVSLNGSGAFVDPNVGVLKTVNLSGVGLAGSGAAAYALFSGGGATASITPAALTISADNASKAFGQAVTLPGSAFTATGLVAGETVGAVTLASAGLPASASVAGGPYAIAPSNAVGGSFSPGNYAISYVTGLLTVTPNLLIITADNAAKTYGQDLTFAPGAFTASGLRNGDTVGTVVETSAGAGPTAGVRPSPYAITPSAAAGGTFIASNYTVSYVDGALTVTPRPLTVQVGSLSKVYGQVITFAPGAFSSTGLQNGETIGAVAESSAGAAAGASVLGSPYAIAGSGASGGTFNPANYLTTYIPGALTVTRAPLTVTADSLTKQYGQVVAFAPDAFTSSGLVNGDSITSVVESSAGSGAAASVPGGPYAIAIHGASGSGFNAANYATTYVPGTLRVTPAPLVLTANSVSKTYGVGVTFAPGAFTSAGLMNGDTVGSVVETSGGSGAGAGVAGSPYTIAASGAAGGSFTPANYATTYVPGALTVVPASLVVIPNDLSKPYLETLTFAGTEFTITGLVNGDTVGAVTLTSPGAGASALPSSTGYPIEASHLTGGTFTPANYATTYEVGRLTVGSPEAPLPKGGTLIQQADSAAGPALSPGDTGAGLASSDYNGSGAEIEFVAGARQAIAPAGLQLAVLGQGVRMPVPDAGRREQIDQSQVQAVEAPREAPQQRPQLTAPAPAPYAAPVHPRKQDRN